MILILYLNFINILLCWDFTGAPRWHTYAVVHVDIGQGCLLIIRDISRKLLKRTRPVPQLYFTQCYSIYRTIYTLARLDDIIFRPINNNYYTRTRRRRP